MYLLNHRSNDLIEDIIDSKLMKILVQPKVLLGVMLFGLTDVPVLIEKYIFSDLGFLKWLVLLMGIDFITGVAKVWKNEGLTAVTSKGFRDTVSKCIQYGAFLIVTHAMTHFSINGEVVFKDFLWLDKIAFEFLILIELKSNIENIQAINPRLHYLGDIAERTIIILEKYTKKIKK